MLEFKGLIHESLRYGWASQRLVLCLVLEFNGFNSLISPLWHEIAKTLLSLFLESFSARCSNLTGLSLKLQRLFRERFFTNPCLVLEFNGFNSLISPLWCGVAKNFRVYFLNLSLPSARIKPVNSWNHQGPGQKTLSRKVLEWFLSLHAEI